MFGPIMYFLLWGPLQVVRWLWWNWRIEGVENLPPTGGMVLAVNHINWIDIPVLGASLPLAHRPWWIAKAELFINPLVKWWMRQMRVVPIQRGKRDMAALARSEEVLKDGGGLVIFPEGHRSRTPGLLEGRSGAIRLAVRTGCPIVPIAIWGTEVGLRGAARRRPLRVRIGQPYHPAAEPGSIPWDRMNELTEELMLRIAALMPEPYWGFYHERMLQARASAERPESTLGA